MTYDEYRARIIAAQEQWNKDRAAIYTVANIGNEQFSGGFEPPKITNEDLALFETLPLEDLVQRVAAMKPGNVLQAAEAWFKIGTAFRDTTDTFNASVQRTIAGGWSGQAASKAAEAVQRYSEGAGQLTTAAHLLYFKLTEMYTGLHQTQTLMPGVAEAPDPKGKTLPQDGVMKAGDYSAEEAREEAKRILQSVYWQVANQTDHGVPIIPPAPTLVSNSPGTVTPSSGPMTSGPQGTDSNGDPSAAPSDKAPSGQPTNQPSEAGDPTPGTQPAGVNPDSTTPASTTSPAANPAATQANPATQAPTGTNPTTNVPGTTTPSPTGTGTPTSPTRPNPGSPGTTSGRPTGVPGTPTAQPNPGRSIPGVPQQPGVTPAAAAASNTSSARPGTAGAPGGMAPGAAGQRKDEEQTSGTKDYLITRENGEEVTGLDSLPKAVPPVIGGDSG
ncbi:hypothetical protein [Nocardia sp. NPDC052316]|uniref:PPE domain-containing protein n=1 Tax=Nocardia sp. NPDC052316 TaxID=3364329 RepID=UPI0037C9AA11